MPRGTVKQLRLFAFDYGYQGLANHTYIGIEGPWDVHRILGTVKVESDGSAAFRIPANTPIAVQPLDEDGKALQLMRSWFVAMPGENLSCVGCHERHDRRAARRHRPLAARQDAAGRSSRGSARPAGSASTARSSRCSTGTASAATTTNRTRDRSSSDLRQDNVQTFSRAYQELQKHVRRPGPESDYHMFPPAEYHADTSPLIQMLDKGHHGVKLDREAYERLYTWIDLNVPYYGTWGEFREIPRGQRERRAELRKLYAGIDEDYEDDPRTARRTRSSRSSPSPPQPAKVVAVECPDWPFDDGEARARQGEDRERTITLGTIDDRPLQI